jgi:hypothetical protein
MINSSGNSAQIIVRGEMEAKKFSVFSFQFSAGNELKTEN